MQIAQQPAIVHVAHDVLDGVEGEAGIGRVVHRQHDAGERSECPGMKERMPPKVYQMFRLRGVGKVDSVSWAKRISGRRASIQRAKPVLG